MKVGFGYLDGLTITVSEEMEPRSWFIYDRDGKIIQTGMAGFGALTHDDVAIPVRATVGRSVWEALRSASPLPLAPADRRN